MADSQIASPINKNNWIPNLSGRIDPIVEQAIRYLYNAIYHLRDTGDISPAAKQVITTIAAGATPTAAVVAHIATQLSAGGSSPINVTGLPGVLPTPQTSSGPPTVTALPAASDPLSFIGSLVIFGGIEYQYRSTPSGNAWVRTVSVGASLNGDLATFRTVYPPADYPAGTSIRLTEGPSFIVQTVTGVNHWFYLSGYQADVIANIPTASLVADDVGYTFSATDYVQQYQWDGTQFHFQTNSGSAYVQFFNGTAPSYGLWGAANGSNYNTSQDDGTVLSMTSSASGAGYYWRR